MTFRELFTALVGHAASSLWFLPPVSKLLHRLRGVRFEDPSTVFIGRYVLIDNRFPHLVSIHNDVWLTARTTILSHYMYSNYQQEKFNAQEVVKPVVIERGVFVGVGSVILPGVTLGEGCYIAANSTVTRDIPAGCLAAGSPAQVIRKLGLSKQG